MDIYKKLGSTYPSDTSTVSVYTVPTGKAAIISKITVCNTDASAQRFSIIMTTDAGIPEPDFIYKSQELASQTTYVDDGGYTLEEDMVVKVYVSSGTTISFNVFGSEIDQVI